jgi:hypothetical protein
VRGLIAAAALAGPILTSSAAGAEPMSLQAGKPAVISCETSAVVVAPEAASTRGLVRMRLEAHAGDATGQWTITDIAATHTASFAARHKEVCASGCALIIAPGVPVQLWAPGRVAPASIAAGAPLTIATLDPATFKLKASTIIDNAIAALEQGECKIAP